MSQRSYLFSKPNQSVYKPMLKAALINAGLWAEPSSAGARYALQVSFEELKANDVGLDFVRIGSYLIISVSI